MARPGRPTKCTQELIKTIAKCIEDGSSIEKACDLNEITPKSYQEWRNRGQFGEQPFCDFLCAIKRAFALRSARRVKRIEECGQDRITIDDRGAEKIVKGDWQAAAWLEERQNRAEFGRYITLMKFDLPDQNMSEMEQVLFLSKQIVEKLAQGELSGEQAQLAANVIEQRRKTLETADYAKRLADLEEIARQQRS